MPSSRLLVVALEGKASLHYANLARSVEESLDLRRMAAHGGSALAVAAFGAAARAAARAGATWDAGPTAPAFAISVGDAVRRGLPTAARATITGRAPLRRGVVEAPFGGAFARALVRHTDVLLVFGAAGPDRWLIEIDEEGAVELRQPTLESDATTGQRARAWTADGGHALLVGPAAEVGLPFANLGSWDAGGSAPSLVGRGGLGATVAQAGVVGIVVGERAERDPQACASASTLARALESSPRLVARALGGTLELGDVRGEAAEVRPREGERRTRHGCKGCPTPCGWQFQVDGAGPNDDAGAGSRVGGRFAALQGLVRDGDGEAALAALGRCNELGMDARTVALLLTAEALDPGLLLDPASSLHQRALALTPEDDREPARPLMPTDLPGRVGIELGARGPEPLRSLSVLGLRASETSDAATRVAWQHDFRMRGLQDDETFNAGVIAHWQECYAAALDHSGFCAFSGSALLADGALGLDALALAVTGCMDGDEWLAMGAEICALHRTLRGRSPEEDVGASGADLPAAAVRGYVEAVGGTVALPVRDRPVPAVRDGGRDRAGRVRVHASGLLAAKLGGYPGARAVVEPGTGRALLELDVEVGPDGASVRSLLERLADALPAAGRWLLQPGGEPLPAVLIAGRGGAGRTVVGGGETVELLLVIPGG
ncbi:aldehyde ferredoxin oxidoreductase N-terminal domain-containing protein [Saltatorellus ferox]